MKRTVFHRLCALLLVFAMMSGVCATVQVSAFEYPSAYWALHDAWEAADKAKDIDKVISIAQQTYDLLRPLGLGQDVCLNLVHKSGVAAWCSEIKGDLSGAITWLERQREVTEWLSKNYSSNYTDSVYCIDAKITALKAASSPSIYAFTNEPGRSYSGSGAYTTGTLYGSATDSKQSGGESATLMYVTFGDDMDYWVKYYTDSSDIFKQIVNNGGVIEVAWNFSPESDAGAQAVLDADSYIKTSLKTLGSLKNVTILLRLGAEMNLWCSANIYKQAFQKVAKVAHNNYSNIKMVFSPNDLSSPGVDFTSFYPGDSYVDWIGMSTYHNSNYTSVTGDNKTTPSYTYDYSYNAALECAYWNEGYYDDPLVAIKPIVDFAQSHKKPVMISECGFGYKNRSTGKDQTAYAVTQVNKFYSYVNMVYPQVKAVFYFNTNFGTGYDYALSENAKVEKAYKSAISSNGGYLTSGSTTAGTWKALSELGQQTGKVKLATYAPLPGKSSCSVAYYVDGKLKTTVTEAPYYYTLNTNNLSSGPHTIRVVATSGQFSVSSEDTITVNNPNAPFYDVSPTSYCFDAVNWALQNGITSGIDKTHFAPDASCTRAQIVTFLWNAAGRPAPKSTSNPFVDVKLKENGKKPFYYDAVLWAVENGITSGVDKTHFAPDATCTRAQAVTFLWNANGKPPAKTTSHSFTDVDSGRFYYKAMLWAVGSGVVAGTTATTFSPNSNCTRAQIVTFLYRNAKNG